LNPPGLLDRGIGFFDPDSLREVARIDKIFFVAVKHFTISALIEFCILVNGDTKIYKLV
jgi:hypothetical protein